MPVAAATPLPSPTPTSDADTQSCSGSTIRCSAGRVDDCSFHGCACAVRRRVQPEIVEEDERSPALPVELNGVSVSVNGAAAGLYLVSNADKQINFVVPTRYCLRRCNGCHQHPECGCKHRHSSSRLLQITAAQPDIFYHGRAIEPLRKRGNYLENRLMSPPMAIRQSSR